MKIFVARLSFKTTPDRLKTAFAEYGEVTDCKIIKDRETGRSKGFGFVTMSNSDDAQRAIDNLNKSDLDGREIVVNEARERQPN